jgi:hypothetical protein
MHDHGLEFDEAWGLILDGVTVEFCGGDGVHINSGNDAKIVNSKIIYNAGTAVYINEETLYTKVIGSLLRAGAGHYALYLGGQLSDVTGNTVVDEGGENTQGIFINGTKNLIAGNIIHLKTAMVYGIHLSESSSGNYIANNLIQADAGKEILDEGQNNIISSIDPKTSVHDFYNPVRFELKENGKKKGKALCVGSDNIVCPCGKCP